jgi:hypothetical protein
MAFDAIINGAGGVIFWGAPFLPKGSETWPALLKVASELKSLQPALTGEWLAPDHTLTVSNRNVEAAVRRAGNTMYLLLANAMPQPAADVELRLGANTQRLNFGPWEVKVIRQ